MKVRFLWLLCLLLGVAITTIPAPGDLDPSFGVAGKVFSTFGSDYDQAFDMALQPDGKIVVTGRIGSFEFGVVRYNDDGTLDTNFDADGRVTFTLPDSITQARAIAVQPDGQILVAANGGNISGGNILVVRFNSDGSLDATFSNDGWLADAGPYYASLVAGIAVQSDGQIVVASMSYGFFAGQNIIVLRRYNPDGTPDPSFGVGGVATSHQGLNFNSTDLALDSTSGRIVVVGFQGPSPEKGFIASYVSDGTVDLAFNGSGYVTVSGDGIAESYTDLYSVAIQSDGKILAGGVMAYSAIDPANPDGSMLFRYNTDGSPDSGFGDDGIMLTSIHADCCDHWVVDIAVQSNGKIVATAGYKLPTDNAVAVHTENFHVMRYTSDGSPDATWGVNGIVSTDFDGHEDHTAALEIQPDGKIVVAGNVRQYHPATDTTDSHFALARYEGESATPTDTTPPVITPTVTGTLGDNGWYRSNVQVTWSVVDAESTVGSQTGCGATTISTDTGGTILTCMATSAGGTDSQSVTIKRDATAPTLAPTVSPNPVSLNGAATATPNATDGLSLIASQSCDAVDTSATGNHQVACTAIDNAGNTGGANASYQVVSSGFTFTGFFQPVDNLPKLNVATAGSAIPVKFSLGGNQGLAIFAPGSPASSAIACEANEHGSPIKKGRGAGGTLSYDPRNSVYTYIWKTDKSWKGTCQMLVVELTDGSQHLAKFRFNK